MSLKTNHVMKKNIYFVIIFSIFNWGTLLSQQINNSDFENWTNSNNAENWTCYITANNINISTSDRSNDANSGDYSAELRTKSIFNFVVPGMIQLGQLDIDNLEPVGGIPFSSKPTALEVNLKYEQEENDSIVIFAYLSKFNKSDNKSTQIGGMYITYDEPIDEFTTFIFPIYYIEEGQPDTINIGFFSSNQDPHPGSTLWVDDLTLHYDDFLLPPQTNNPTEITETQFIANWTGADYTNHYILDVASDINFTNYLPGFEHKNVGDTTSILVPIQDTTIQEIYYRVKADYDSVVSDYSNAINFAIPYPPDCYEPINLEAFQFTAVWEQQPLAAEYILDVATDENFTNFFNSYYYYVTDSTFKNIVATQPETDYYYRVRARYISSGKSQFSNVVKVTTTAEPIVEFLEFLTPPEQLIIYADTSYYNSELYVYRLNGQLFWSSIITDKYTEIGTPTTEILLVQLIKPNGVIIRRKMRVTGN